jgi:predicted GNAT family acetyltransferase
MVRIEITNVADKNRYEARDGERLVGVFDYQLSPGRIVMPHVEVLPEVRGRGIAGQLTEHAVRTAQAEGLRIVATCPYVRAWLAARPEFGTEV